MSASSADPDPSLRQAFYAIAAGGGLYSSFWFFVFYFIPGGHYEFMLWPAVTSLANGVGVMLLWRRRYYPYWWMTTVSTVALLGWCAWIAMLLVSPF